MILTGNEILKEMLQTDITIEPFNKTHLNPNSYNYRISDYIAIPKYNHHTHKMFYETIVIPAEGFILDPETTYLSHTYETLGSEIYAMSLIGRSSLGRLGLFLEVSADLGHTKSCHKWTLEIVATLPIKLYSGMVIGQVSFWKNFGSIEKYNGQYGFLNYPQESFVLQRQFARDQKTYAPCGRVRSPRRQSLARSGRPPECRRCCVPPARGTHSPSP